MGFEKEISKTLSCFSLTRSTEHTGTTMNARKSGIYLCITYSNGKNKIFFTNHKNLGVPCSFIFSVYFLKMGKTKPKKGKGIITSRACIKIQIGPSNEYFQDIGNRMKLVHHSWGDGLLDLPCGCEDQSFDGSPQIT